MRFCLFTVLLCLFGGHSIVSAQCEQAFPELIRMFSCGFGDSPVCVVQMPTNIDYEWNVAPDQDCAIIGSNSNNSAILSLTPEEGFCDYGPNPLVVISGGLGLELSALNPTGCGMDNGQIVVSTGAAQPVLLSILKDGEPYIWQEIFNTPCVFDSLEAGHYSFSLFAEEEPFCVAAFSYNLEETLPDSLDVQFQFMEDACLPGFTPLEALVEGGTPPYQYEWSTGDTATAAIFPLVSDVYVVTVTDANDCQVENAYNTFFPTQEYWIDGQVTDADCEGSPTGAIDISVSGFFDEDDLEFFWDDLSGEGPVDRTDLSPGIYTLETVDLIDYCSQIWFFEVGQSGSLEVNLISANDNPNSFALCHQDSLTLIPEITGGVGPFTYSWSGGSNDSILVIDSTGTYSVTVEDSEGCQNTDQAGVFQPEWDEFTFSIEQPDCDQSNGSIQVEYEGFGTPLYAWSNREGGSFIDNLPADTYLLTATRFGCDTVITIELGNTLPELEIFTPEGDTIDCYQPSVSLSSGLTGPSYIYHWVGESDNTLGTSPTLVVDTGMSFTLYVTDTLINCTASATKSIEFLGFPPEAQPIFSPFQSCEEPAVIHAASDPDEELETTVQWPNGDLFFLMADDSLVLPQVGTYLVTVRSLTTGCESVYSYEVDDFGAECGYLDGYLYLTDDCSDPTSGQIAPGYLVQVSNADGSGSPTLIPTDSDGYWRANLQAGDYIVEAQPFYDELYEPCPAISVALIPDQLGSSTDVGMTALVDCAAPRVDVNIPLLRRCFNNPIHIAYYNDGPELLTDAQLVIELDSFLFFQSATPPPDQVLNGFTLVYDLGDLPAFTGGSITVNAIVSCSAVLGQNHCVLAQIPITEPCPEPSGWSGASVGLAADCDEEVEELRFDISNLSDEFGMTVPLSYVIVEDGLMLSPAPIDTLPLDPDETITVIVPANGSTYHLITNQEPNSPASPMPTIAVEGCGRNEADTFSLFYINQLSLGDEDVSWVDLECQNNQGAYDPNDKQAIPRGYADEHFIDGDQRLEYTIRFQNTGTDTAFNVVLLDTLTEELDITTFRPGAASHDFSYLIDSNRVLEVSFPDIMLPDSFIAPIESQGAYQFSIEPVAGLDEGTRIENRAGIYFDFNEPVITNTYFHTIGKGYLQVISSISGPIPSEPQFVVYPNPSPGWVRIKLDEPGLVVKMHLYDYLGRQLRAWNQIDTNIPLDLNGLPGGTYYLHLIRDDGQSMGVRTLYLVYK
ncbi:MAG: T9SS type A sorting domain-containing protein [Bacteroidota bacterium]